MNEHDELKEAKLVISEVVEVLIDSLLWEIEDCNWQAKRTPITKPIRKVIKYRKARKIEKSYTLAIIHLRNYLIRHQLADLSEDENS